MLHILLLIAALQNCLFEVQSKCYFELYDQRVVYNSSLARHSLSTTSLIWSHFGSWFQNRLKTQPPPSYPSHVVVELSRSQINFQAGTIFDEYGCMSNHSMVDQDWNKRLKYMRTIPAHLLSKDHVFDYDDGIFMWGSMYAVDYQHAVIDFLPLFDTLLRSEILFLHPTFPVIVGPYVKFFEHLYPFSLFKYVYRDQKYKQQGGTIPTPFTFKRVFYVDIIDREQSYVLPGSYDILLPFLREDFKFDPAVHSLSYLQQHVSRFKNINESSVVTDGGISVSSIAFSKTGRQLSNSHSNTLQLQRGSGSVQSVRKRKGGVPSNIRTVVAPTTTLLPLNTSGTHRHWVVYLDRSALTFDLQYIKSNGKTNGRNVLNQTTLLRAIEKSLISPYKLMVHTCTNWRIDREVMPHAAVIIGPHGGHFTNMIFAQSGTHIIEFGRSALMRVLNEEIRVNKGVISNKNSKDMTNMSNPSSSASAVVSAMPARAGKYNPRWVFIGMSNALHHIHWSIEDLFAVKAYQRNAKQMIKWSDNDMVVSEKQVVDTLRAIGVAK